MYSVFTIKGNVVLPVCGGGTRLFSFNIRAVHRNLF